MSDDTEARELLAAEYDVINFDNRAELLRRRDLLIDTDLSIPDRVALAAITTALHLRDEARSQALEESHDAIKAAYIQGALDVHTNWQEDRDPDFTEAASDYLASLAHDKGD